MEAETSWQYPCWLHPLYSSCIAHGRDTNLWLESTPSPPPNSSPNPSPSPDPNPNPDPDRGCSLSTVPVLHRHEDAIHLLRISHIRTLMGVNIKSDFGEPTFGQTLTRNPTLPVRFPEDTFLKT